MEYMCGNDSPWFGNRHRPSSHRFVPMCGWLQNGNSCRNSIVKPASISAVTTSPSGVLPLVVGTRYQFLPA